ncbi:SLC13 family permease [Cysteiniphilum sp. JM-1]|uniref:SLC13 family permease n=1 Tax=Cysteiniphilum sp. JM-1 TaxID=2610891 RepID=UPI001244B1D2|nr:SLC13 family permease [Cysteiniphilum sp. JM-1]
MHYLPLLLLVIIFIAASLRKVGRFSAPIWLVMLVCAIIVIASGNISLQQAWQAIDLPTIFYLITVFFIGSALHDSRLLDVMLVKYVVRHASQEKLLCILCFGSGLLSALFLNDTIAIVGADIVITLIKRHSLASTPYLYALAFSMTIGSVFSPIGNPQNLLIAGHLSTPFISFFGYLFIPSMITLYACYRLIAFVSRKELCLPMSTNISMTESVSINVKAVTPVIIALISFVILIILKVLLTLIEMPLISLTYIALIACLPIIIAYQRRMAVFKHLDWTSIIFFVAMFVFMHAVWLTGITQSFLSTHQAWLLNPLSLIMIGFVLSQMLSNVPAVMLLLPLLNPYGQTSELFIALAVGSTLSGNLSMLGAASNVILFQSAERVKIFAFRFASFLCIGLILSLIFLGCYWLMTLCFTSV